MDSLALTANFYSYFNFIVCSVLDFISAIAFVSRCVYFNRTFLELTTWVQQNELIHMVFTNEIFFEVAIGSWPDWYFNPRPLNSVQNLYPTELLGHELNLHLQLTLYSYSNFIICWLSDFISTIAFATGYVYLNRKYLEIITQV